MSVPHVPPPLYRPSTFSDMTEGRVQYRKGAETYLEPFTPFPAAPSNFIMSCGNAVVDTVGDLEAVCRIAVEHGRCVQGEVLRCRSAERCRVGV